MKKILWVDDDALVLSSARRLLQLHGFDIHTIDNPLDALPWMEDNPVSVIISDQRMPQMTGVQLLVEVKEKFPLVTRIMVTGFMDAALIQQAINEADVFRFITKPWTEAELIADIVQGQEHHEKMLAKEHLSAQIREQNKQLQKFTEDLESLITSRTFELAEAKKDQEVKNIKIKNLVSFIQNLSEVESPLQVIDTLFSDIKKELPVQNCFFAFTDFNQEAKILFRIKGKWQEHKAQRIWSHKREIRLYDKEDRSYISNETKVPVSGIIAIPLIRFKEELQYPHVLFLEIESTHSDLALDFLTSRLQVLSLGVERLISQNKLKLESKRWEKTFDSISDPLCILNSDYEIIRKNTSYDQQIKKIDPAWLQNDGKAIKIHEKIFNFYLYKIQDQVHNGFESYLGYFHDVTDEKTLYQKLVQGEKIAAVGLLAGNIAHELNNPLTGIRSMAQLLIEEPSVMETHKQDLIEIDKACQRCQGVIQSLIDFSDNKESHFQKICIQDVIQKTLPLLKTALRFHSTQIHLPSENLYVLGDFKLFQQVLFNLVNNACQSMIKPGVVKIEVKLERKNIIIDVSDTGAGVLPSIQDKLFEPFVSSKKEGEGTGLGLSFCKSVVEKMNGSIKLLQTSSSGSTFSVYLPECK